MLCPHALVGQCGALSLRNPLLVRGPGNDAQTSVVFFSAGFGRAFFLVLGRSLNPLTSPTPRLLVSQKERSRGRPPVDAPRHRIGISISSGSGARWKSSPSNSSRWADERRTKLAIQAASKLLATGIMTLITAFAGQFLVYRPSPISPFFFSREACRPAT